MKKSLAQKKCLHFKAIAALMIISYLPLSGQQLASISSANATGGWIVKDPFKSEVFIENKGQFDEKNHQNEKILYGIDNGEMHVYFTEKGLTYHICKYDFKDNTKEGREEVRERGEEEFHKHGTDIDWTRFEKYFINKSSFVNIEWLGSNKDAHIQVQDHINEYYTYSLIKGKESIPVKADAYKKLTYKNIYPNIDIEYYFPDASSALSMTMGIKYNVIVHPGGDISQVKMKYSGDKGLSIDNEGNLIIQTPSDPYTDHAPVSFYQGDESNSIKTQFIINDHTVSFLINSYDKKKSLTIDPWVTNPAFTTSNKGYGIRVDYSGNCYVYGGGAAGFGTSSVYQVKKYNNLGVIQWTFTTPTLSMGYYGDIATDRVGNTFIGAGFGFTGGNMIIKLNPAGTQSAAMAAYTPPGGGFSFEQWRLSYNQKTNSNSIYIGGGGSSGVQNGMINTNLTGTPSVYNSHISANHGLKDIVYMAQDATETYIYSNLSCNSSSNGVCADPEDRTIAKVATTSMGTNIWRVSNPSQFMEVGQANYLNGGSKTTGLNGAVVCNNYLYTFDGGVLTAWNTSNGASAYTANTGGTFQNFSGIDVDNCCRVYVGLHNTIKRYSPTLVFDISIPANNDVYDLQIDPLNDKNIYVTGNNFVQLIQMPVCPTCISATHTNVSGCTYGSATTTVNDPSSTAPFKYSWSNGGTTQTISGLTAGTYYVTVTDAASPCPLTWKDTVVITGTFIPCGPTVTATGGVLCTGACMSITATGASTPGPFTYSWQTGGLSGSSVSVCPTTTTTYTVTATDGAGATASATAKVTVNPKPTITLSGASVCPGVCATITAGGGVSYSWSAPFSGTASTQSACPAVTTTYSVTGTDANGCTNTTTATVTINALPTVTVSNLTICKDTVGSTTASGASTYTWSCGGTGATIKPNTSVIGTSTCTVTGTDANGCKNTATSTIKVNDCSTPSVTIVNGTICTGNCYNITAVGTGGVGTLTYSWSPNLGAGAGPFSVCPTTTTNYTVTVTDANGTTASHVGTVTVNSLPTITATTATICNGACGTITASGAGTGTYTWASPLGNGASQNVCPAGTTTYSLTGTDANGCTNTATTTVTVNPLPVITVADASICPGGSTTLTASGASTYTWSPATGLTPTTGATVTANPATTTTYTICGVSASGCSSCTTAKVTVGALIATTGPNVSICSGACTTLSSSGGTIFSWSPATGLNNTSISNPVACPTVTTTYTVNVSDGTCSDAAVVTVTVNPNPVPTISGPMIICSGSSTTLTATGGGTYSWSPGGQTTASITVNPTNPSNTYTVTVTTSGCTGTATAVVTVNPTPAPIISGINLICTGDSTTLTASTSGPYSWSTGETTVSITVRPILPSTTYSVSVTVNGCTGTASKAVTVTPPVIAGITGNNICEGEKVTLTASGGKSYLWNTGAATKSITDSPPAGTITYTVTAADGSCTDTATYIVTVNPVPNAIASGDTTINYGNSTQLKATGGGTYNWAPPAGLSCIGCANPVASPTATTQYCVTIKNTAGCTDSSCVTVVVEIKCGFEGEIFVPNGFSPNGDGQNDVLYVRGKGITGMYWVIYDRWGEKVFDTTNPKQGWDGTYKGKQLDPDVFVYYLKVTCITGDEISKKGNVAIIK